MMLYGSWDDFPTMLADMLSEGYLPYMKSDSPLGSFYFRSPAEKDGEDVHSFECFATYDGKEWTVHVPLAGDGAGRLHHSGQVVPALG